MTAPISLQRVRLYFNCEALILYPSSRVKILRDDHLLVVRICVYRTTQAITVTIEEKHIYIYTRTNKYIVSVTFRTTEAGATLSPLAAPPASSVTSTSFVAPSSCAPTALAGAAACQYQHQSTKDEKQFFGTKKAETKTLTNPYTKRI